MSRITRTAALAACATALLVIPSIGAQAPGDVQKAVDAAYAKYRTLKEGKNADYIPALAKVDPNLFGIAVVTADGKVYTAGDVKTEVSIQSHRRVAGEVRHRRRVAAARRRAQQHSAPSGPLPTFRTRSAATPMHPGRAGAKIAPKE